MGIAKASSAHKNVGYINCIKFALGSSGAVRQYLPKRNNDTHCFQKASKGKKSTE